jgi:hypothetical protein
MANTLDTILKTTNFLLKKLAANAGCDYIADASAHKSRIGKISSLIILGDTTQIGSITEVIEGTETTFTTTTKSYLNVVLPSNTLVVLDNPLSSITLAVGSAMIYYIDI